MWSPGRKTTPPQQGNWLKISTPTLLSQETYKKTGTESLKPQFDHLQNAMDQWCNKQIPHHWSAVTGAVKWHDSEGASESEPSWWLNQPIWKICSSKWIISPSRVENNKYLKPPTRSRWTIDNYNLYLNAWCDVFNCYIMQCFVEHTRCFYRVWVPPCSTRLRPGDRYICFFGDATELKKI